MSISVQEESQILPKSVITKIKFVKLNRYCTYCIKKTIAVTKADHMYLLIRASLLSFKYQTSCPKPD